MSVLRIVDFAYNLFSDQFYATVDILGTPDGEEDRTVLVPVPQNKIYTPEILKGHIETYIKNQKNASPDYTGLTWRCDQI